MVRPFERKRVGMERNVVGASSNIMSAACDTTRRIRTFLSFLHSLEGMRRLMSHENQGARASPPVRKTVRKSVSKTDLRTIELSVSKETLYLKEGADSRFKGCGAVESIRAKGLKGGCGAGKKRSHEIGKRDRDHLGDHSGPIGQLILLGYSSREKRENRRGEFERTHFERHCLLLSLSLPNGN